MEVVVPSPLRVDWLASRLVPRRSRKGLKEFAVWQIILYGLLGVRKRWIFWLTIPTSALLALGIGFKDAGSYQQYSAGSILSPDRYRDTVGTLIYGERSGLTASQLNKILGDMRGENVPAFVFFLVLFALSVGAAYLASFAYAVTYDKISDVLEIEDAKQYFIKRYEEALGDYPASGFFEDSFQFHLVNYIYDMSIADNWRLLLADAPESFITEVAGPIQTQRDEWHGKVLKLAM